MSEKTYKILLIDDDTYLLDIYSVKFEEEGMEMDTADSGEKALEKMRDNDYDVILLDIVMPTMNGFEVLQKMKKEALAEDAAVIILSNQGQPEDIQKAKNYDVEGYIVKASAVPSEVVRRVEEIVEKHAE